MDCLSPAKHFSEERAGGAAVWGFMDKAEDSEARDKQKTGGFVTSVVLHCIEPQVLHCAPLKSQSGRYKDTPPD